tara:strand:- start:10383 stop:10733 length:351 start_codon:yes stop_codon:yes gene_type:complete
MTQPKAWKIKKFDYSSGPWRLVNEKDQEVYDDVVIDHPDLGKSRISMPVCANTKAELIDKILAAFTQMRSIASERSQALRIIQTWASCDKLSGEPREQAMQCIADKCESVLKRAAI